ncbi:MAG: isocitrate lyase/PEP mutase family protein [Hyphomonas sp.]|nr:isocitrate lyase/PEP mutase family protein [Hyphomonas sp.]
MLRKMIEGGEFIVAPGVYDGFSAMVAERYPFKAVYMGGYCVAASRWGHPDAGLVGLSEMIDALRVIRRVCTKPVIADADTGYGGLLNVQHTVREFEDAGAAAIHIEDQEMPKKCGHTKGKRVIPADEMAAKVAVAVESRRSDDFMIIARTDSRQMYDLDEAIRRSILYKEAGADVLFIDAPQSLEEVARIGKELPGPLMLNMVPQKGFVTPNAAAENIEKMGFAIAHYPGLLATPAMAAMERSIEHFLGEGLMDSTAMPKTNPHELVGFPAVWADEERWQQKFGDAPVPEPAE